MRIKISLLDIAILIFNIYCAKINIAVNLTIFNLSSWLVTIFFGLLAILFVTKEDFVNAEIKRNFGTLVDTNDTLSSNLMIVGGLFKIACYIGTITLIFYYIKG